MSVSPELAAVLCTGFLSISGVVIAALLSNKKNGAQAPRMCSEHSGITTDIKNIYYILTEVRADLKSLLERPE